MAAATWNAIIQQSSDDAREAGGTVTTNDGVIILTAGTQWAGLRFQNCPIANSEGIVSVTLTLELLAGYTSPDGLGVYGEDVDDQTTFATSANNISGRTRTTAVVPWAGTGLASGDQSPSDLASILSEITTRPGYSEGNDIGFILDPSASTSLRFRAWDGSTSTCARLSVVYEEADAGGQPMMARARFVPGMRRTHGHQGW